MLRDYLAYAADGSLPGAHTDAGSVADPAETGEAMAPAEVADAPAELLDAPDEDRTAPVPEAVAAEALPVVTGGPVRAEFARRLRQSGLVVHEAFGGAGHPIDLAVEDPERPGQVLVAVETDGLEYAAMHSTRDRDRLRGEQLERLGWEHLRVWTTDLFRDPARDVSRVHAAVQRAAARRAVEEAARPRRATAAATRLEPQPPVVVEQQPAPSEAPEEAQLTFDGLEAEPDEFTPAPDAGARKRRVRGPPGDLQARADQGRHRRRLGRARGPLGPRPVAVRAAAPALGQGLTSHAGAAGRRRRRDPSGSRRLRLCWVAQTGRFRASRISRSRTTLSSGASSTSGARVNRALAASYGLTTKK